ncbi:MAG: division/cell wall cluster transcriptional repressor MraZ [Clostridia bacterium]|nr:division/cell wall cluster transcriptional repressor MraZ [Clostridia bacterium]
MMTRLIGSYQHNIDSKGRVIIPAKYREELGETFYITCGTDGCLFVLPQSQWIAIEEKIASMPISQAAAFQRAFYSSACEALPDKQGRVLIPQNLRDYAGLDKDVTIAGAGTRLEIWDTDKWNKLQSDAQCVDFLSLMSGIGL